MMCDCGVIVIGTGLGDRHVAGAFNTTNFGMQRLSLAPLGALSAACECASLSKRGSSQSAWPHAGRT